MVRKIAVKFGYKINDPRAKELIPIIDGWKRAIERYTALQGDDAAYYYNERANLSLLAAGAWLGGKTALEEYSSQKGRGSKKKSGRVDLYISGSEHDAEIEAKQRWILATTPKKEFKTRVRDAIKLSTQDAKKNYGAASKFGCVFFIPKFSRGKFPKYKQQSSQLILGEIERYLNLKITIDIWAWCFPAETRNRYENKVYYPGILLAIKGVKYWQT